IDEEISPICKSDSCKSSSNKNNSKVIPVVASVASVVVLVLVVALAILWKIKRNDLSSSDQKTDVVDSRKTNQLQGSLKNRQFTHAQLKRMTNNFGRVVGKGGFGTVYHGYLDETQVAVKMLSLSPVQGYKQFQAEVELLLRVHHRNLTTIVGYCDYGSNMGLIYEFMAKGNLAEYLKAFPLEGDTHVITVVAGTPWYVDSDFGVVLLEIITNRPVTTKTYNQTIHISQWVSLMLTNGDMEAIADSRMQGDFEIASMKKEVDVAMACPKSTGITVFVKIIPSPNPRLMMPNLLVMKLGQLHWLREYVKVYVLGPKMDDDQRQNSSPSLESKNRRFTFAEVQRMSNYLERILGKGGFGTVFRGYLDDSQAAVKMLSHSSVQGYKQRYI
ncbi:hypothetical protein Gohar_023383, partial [Gossypium harknessii]|nr:hypothetical protein [Gossypium harknessii]